MIVEREPCPERLLWAVARAFETAAEAPDPASRLLTGFAGLLLAAGSYRLGDQPEAAAAVAQAIARAAPLLADLSAADPGVADAATRGAASLAVMCGQPRAEVEALVACGLAAEFEDLAGLARAHIEVAWRSGRIAARRGSAEHEPSGPVPGTPLH